jgi:ferrous iron transport protein B
VGYTVAYLVYTVGTLISARELLNVGAAISGLLAILAMTGFIIYLIINTNRKLRAEKLLKSAKTETVKNG